MEPLDQVTIRDFFRVYDLNRITYYRAHLLHRVAANYPVTDYREGRIQQVHLLLEQIYKLTNEAITRLDPTSQAIITSDYRDQQSTAEVTNLLGVGRTTYFSLKKQARQVFATILNDLLAKNGIPLLILP